MASGRDGAVVGSIRTLFEAGTSAALDDAQLLDRFLKARDEVSEAAFSALVTRHGPMVLGVAREILRDVHDSHDAFQATFLVLARKAGSIRRRESLASWLFGVTRKVANRAKADAARRRARELAAGPRELVEPGPAREPEDFAALFEEIDRLPGTYRDPVILCYLDGLTYEAAASQLKCPLGTLSVRLKRARERLRSRLTRRGVMVPAGLLVAGVLPNTASAAVPTSLADLTVRAISKGSAIKPTVAGVVSASVISLAEGTMAAMRYRAMGVGSLGLGVVVLVATAALAMRPAAEEARPAPATPQAAPQASPWSRTFPSGVRVELLAVGEHPGHDMEKVDWRTPNGAPLPEPPFQRGTTYMRPFDGYIGRDFAARVTGLPDQFPAYRWEVVPSQFASIPALCVSDSKVIPGLSAISTTIPAGSKTCKIRVGVASAPWTTRATAGTGGEWGQDAAKVGIIYSKVAEASSLKADFSIQYNPLEVNGKKPEVGFQQVNSGAFRQAGPVNGKPPVSLESEVTIQVAGKPSEVITKTSLALMFQASPDEFRIVAIDRAGREHQPTSTYSGQWETLLQTKVKFDLPTSEIREFRLQARPFEWAEFDGVALQPRGE